MNGDLARASIITSSDESALKELEQVNAMASLPTPKDKPSAGDATPSKCSIIEVHVSELRQLFDAIDPSPFRDRDLDPKAEEFIVGWSKDLPRDSSFALVVDLDPEAGLPNEAAVLREAIREFFRHRAETYRRSSQPELSSPTPLRPVERSARGFSSAEVQSPM